jgi:hypothetical protein
MEYTKDMILTVRYGEVHNTLENVKNGRTSKILKAIKAHKIVTTTVLSAVVFISIDVILITNFFRILSTI